MKFLFRILPIVASIGLTVCCGGHTAAVLDDIETYIQARPDSALAVLRTLDTLSLKTAKDRAHYALLHAMALDKNWIDTTDVNVVMPAVAYYDRHPSGLRKAKAWYYLGRIRYNEGNYADAIVSLTRAKESSSSLDDPRFRSLVFQALGDTYGKTYLSEEAMACADSSFMYCMEAKDTVLAFSSLYRKVQILNNLKRFSQADSLVSFMLENKQFVLPRVLPKLLSDRAMIMINSKKDYVSAKELFENVLAENGRLPGINHWCAYGYVLSALGERKKAEEIFAQLGKTPAQETYIYKVWKSKVEANGHDYASAFTLLEEASDKQMDLLTEILHQSTVKAQRDYNAIQRDRAEESRRLIAWLAILSIITLLMVGIVVLLLLKRKNERVIRKNELLEQENASLQGAVESLSDQVIEMNLQQVQLQREYTQHLQSSFREWGQLYKAYYHSNDSIIDVRDNVFLEARKAVAMLSGDKEGQVMLERRLNEVFSDVMRHYRSDFPGKEENEYHFACFIFAGFDASVLKSAFRIPSLPATYERKSRLKDSIAQSKALYKEQYLRFFK